MCWLNFMLMFIKAPFYFPRICCWLNLLLKAVKSFSVFLIQNLIGIEFPFFLAPGGIFLRRMYVISRCIVNLKELCSLCEQHKGGQKLLWNNDKPLVQGYAPCKWRPRCKPVSHWPQSMHFGVGASAGACPFCLAAFFRHGFFSVSQ